MTVLYSTHTHTHTHTHTMYYIKLTSADIRMSAAKIRHVCAQKSLHIFNSAMPVSNFATVALLT